MREIDLSEIETYAKQLEYLEELSSINEESLIVYKKKAESRK